MKIPDMLENFEHVIIGDVAYFPNLDNNTYHNGPGISSSNIYRWWMSLAHFVAEERNAKIDDEEEEEDDEDNWSWIH